MLAYNYVNISVLYTTFPFIDIHFQQGLMMLTRSYYVLNL